MLAASPMYLPAILRDLLWPKACLACGRKTAELVLCVRCGQQSRPAPAPTGSAEDLGIRAPLAPWAFDNHAPIRTVLHRLKYGNCPWIGRYLGTSIALAGLAQTGYRWDLIIPVPLHPKRFLDRGYNQSEWIAVGLADILKVPVESKRLVRSRNTRTQTAMIRDQRAANVEGAFSVTEGSGLEGLSVLLVDDTLTTGATLHAAARALLLAGVRLVQPVAVARATLRLDEEQPDNGAVIPSQHQRVLDESSSLSHPM